MYINVEQAVFASSSRGRVTGYQVVAKSLGVDRRTCQELCRWNPTQMPSNDPDHWTINYFPISDDWVAVTRTVLGGPEYSCRGGTQVVTLILLLTNKQFESYGCNSIAVARTAMMFGYLRLPLQLDSDQLPTARLPEGPIIDQSFPLAAGHQDAYDDLLDEVSYLVLQARRVAVVGLQRPIEAVERLLPKLSFEERRDFSFTTGLAPSLSRPFQAHFLSEVDVSKRRTLDSQQVVCRNVR